MKNFTNYLQITSLGLLVTLFILQGCCGEEPNETARYDFTPQELAIVPYEQGQIIPFVHSNGYQFQFEVVEDIVSWEEYHDFCEWSCCGEDYYSYQERNTKLQSVYPEIELQLVLTKITEDYGIPFGFDISFGWRNSLSFQVDSIGELSCDNELAICRDSVVINQRVYYGVIEQEVFNYSFSGDSTINNPRSVLYNEIGVLQIKMNNDETYSIDL